ncbi:FHA domain-containing protein [Cohnella sp. CFH 77786]|nr:FHA domain-containing protein [Cohnella sp. CFH 77786]
MTAKGRDPRGTAEWDEPEAEEYAGRYEAADRQAETEASPKDGESQRKMNEHTIPLSRTPAEPAAENEPRLCGIGGAFAGANFRMTASGLSIGRDPALCHVVFPVDVGEVSRRHCTLRYQEEDQLFLLEDHGSSNGTFLPDGERLQPGKRYPLRSGQRFALSGDTHWFEVRA